MFVGSTPTSDWSAGRPKTAAGNGAKRDCPSRSICGSWNTGCPALKVDQGLDRHLRSHTPASIEYEVAGHVVLYLLIRWLIVEAATKTKSNRRKKQSTKQTKVKSCKTQVKKVRICKSISVAFRSAKARDFREAKGDYAAVIDSPVLSHASREKEKTIIKYCVPGTLWELLSGTLRESSRAIRR